VRSEAEALLLENNLIKSLNPKYNILFRDDKSYPYLKITGVAAKDGEGEAPGQRFPRMAYYRGAVDKRHRYFGPYPGAWAVKESIQLLQKVFRLRTCEDTVFANRSRPCLLFQIKRCSAPCTGRISAPDYNALVNDAERFLQGKTTTIQADLAREMAQAAENMEYERAAALRDRIKALTAVQSVQAINPKGVAEADIVALHMEGGQACVQVFFIRGNQSWGNRDFYPRLGGAESPDEVMQAFLMQFYDNTPPPRQILLSHPPEDPDLTADVLSERARRKVEVAVPLRGEKSDLVTNALRNARESLARRMSESATQLRLLEGLADAFELPSPPRRIEVYDNSHIMGTNAVGGMIVAGPDGWIKNQYRKFNIKGTEITPGDDFGMMKEVLTRRFTRLLKDDPDRQTEAWPDLLLIDGGAGQVSAVHEIMAELGVEDIPMIGVAKGQDRDHGKEEFHRHGQRPFALRMNDPVLYFVQRLRDEAHRWAIGTHRARRAKSQMANPLDEIAGIGASRKRALLQHFGSAKAVGRAGLTDLQAAPGISAAMAQKVYDHFNAKG